MQGGLDEFLAARDHGDENDDNEDGANGPEIAVGSRAASRASGAASIAAVSIELHRSENNFAQRNVLLRSLIGEKLLHASKIAD